MFLIKWKFSKKKKKASLKAPVTFFERVDGSSASTRSGQWVKSQLHIYGIGEVISIFVC